MKYFLTITILILTTMLAGCFNRLENKIQTLELHYINWACDCANWATPADIEKYYDNRGDSLADRCIFLEPASESATLPDSLEEHHTIIKVSGSFYKRKGFPKGYSSGEWPDKARVFRYTSYKVLKTHSKEDE